MSDKLIKLDGTVESPDGTTEKTNLFAALEIMPGDYSHIEFTPEQANHFARRIRYLSTGSSAAIPLACGGEKVCPFSFQCPLVELEKQREEGDPHVLPVGKACLVELNLLRQWTVLYLQEYEVEQDNFTEFTYIRDLAEIELMLWRLNQNLSKPEHAELVTDTVVGVDREGNPLTRKEESAFFNAKERLLARKSKIVKLMVGDRQEQYKKAAALKLRETGDISSNTAELQRAVALQLESLRKQQKELGKANPIEVETPDDIIGSEASDGSPEVGEG